MLYLSLARPLAVTVMLAATLVLVGCSNDTDTTPKSIESSSLTLGEDIAITSIEEQGGVLKISIETNIATPFEVMAGLGLSGQAPDDVHIGNSQRVRVNDDVQTIEVPLVQRGSTLPSGLYDVEVNFYTRWGAKDSPNSTQLIANDIGVLRQFSLGGSGEAASNVAEVNERQKYVMSNIGAGDSFDLVVFEERLGNSISFAVENRNQNVRAYYYDQADMTLFRNEATGTVVTWKIGRHSRL